MDIPSGLPIEQEQNQSEYSDSKSNASGDSPSNEKKKLLDKATSLSIAELLLIGMDRPSSGIGTIGPDAGGEDWVGRLIGDYKIEEELGRGGMGAVFRATNMRVGSTVALKLLRFAPGETAERLRRFEIEARAAAQLNHPNIINVNDVGQVGDLYYLAMEYIEGRPLSEMVSKGPLEFERIHRITIDLCTALEFAHEEGIIHRDIKPSNILIEPSGQAQLMDFGLARNADSEAKRHTKDGAIMGTAHYMSPEQAEGRSHLADHRSDIHSLGAVMYEMATGIPPFDGASSYDVIQKVVNDEPIRPKKFTPSLDLDLEIIILKMLEKEPERRYQDISALRIDMERHHAGDPILSRPPNPMYRLKKMLRKHSARAIPAAIALISILGVLLGTILYENSRDKRLTDHQTEWMLNELENPNQLHWRTMHAERLKNRFEEAKLEIDNMPPSKDKSELANRLLWLAILTRASDKPASHLFKKARTLAKEAKQPALLAAVDLYSNPQANATTEHFSKRDWTIFNYHQGHHALLKNERKRAVTYFRAAIENGIFCLEQGCAKVELKKLMMK